MVSAAQCEQLAQQLNLPRYDLLLVADGSGNFSYTPCGWYCCSYFKPTGKVTEHIGGASGGTNNYAELMPFIHALWAFDSAWTKLNKPASFEVACVSDSEVTVRIGNGQYAAKANTPLWAAIDGFRRLGYALRWHHVPRNSNPINARADHVAGKVRKTIAEMR